MANTTDPKSKVSIKSKLVIVEHLLIYTAIVAGAGFYFGTQYSQAQAKHDAQIIKAATAAPAPAPAVEASKN
jgi:hypothetical protein